MPGPFDILKNKITALSPTQAHSNLHDNRQAVQPDFLG